MNYTDLATEAEMRDSKQWLAEMLAAVTAVRDARRTAAEVTCLAQGWRQMRCGVSVIETPLCLAGQTYEFGLGTHADSRIRVRLPSAGKRLTGLCGVDDHDHARRHALPITFAIRTGKRKLWTSGPRKVSDKPARFAADLAGAREFELIATSDTFGCAPANWADLKVELKDGRFARLGEPERGGAGFRFTYGGMVSTEFIDGWKRKKERKAAKDGIVLHRITRTDPATGLAVICEIKEYTDFPVPAHAVQSRRPTLDRLAVSPARSGRGGDPGLPAQGVSGSGYALPVAGPRPGRGLCRHRHGSSGKACHHERPRVAGGWPERGDTGSFAGGRDCVSKAPMNECGEEKDDTRG